MWIPFPFAMRSGLANQKSLITQPSDGYPCLTAEDRVQVTWSLTQNLPTGLGAGIPIQCQLATGHVAFSFLGVSLCK